MGLDILVNQFGFVGGMLVFALWIGSYVMKSKADTQNHVDRTEVDARSKTESAQADAFLSVVKALDKTVDKLGESDVRAQQERTQTLMRIERMTGHMEGMTSVIVGHTRSTDAMKGTVDDFGNRLDEFGTRIRDLPQIQTDIQVLLTSAKKVDAAIDVQAELLALMIKFGSDLENVSERALTIVDLIKRMADKTATTGDPHDQTTLVQAHAE